jgi:hypothetical protein
MERQTTNAKLHDGTPAKHLPSSEPKASARGFRFLWLIVLAALGIASYFLLIDRVDHQLTSEVLRQLRKQFPQHLISVDRARLVHGQSITIDGIRISKPTDQGLRDVVRVGRVVCHGPLDVLGLVQGQLPIETVVVDGLEACLWPLPNGQWCVQELSSGKPLSDRFPAIEVRSGLLRLGHETGGTEREIICHDLQAYLTLDLEAAHRTQLPHSPTPDLVFRASVASSYFAKATIDARMTPDRSQWAAKGMVSQLEYSGRLMEQLPTVIRDALHAAKGFSGEVDFAFSALQQNQEIDFEAKAVVQNGRWLHPMVPYPLDHITGEITCKNQLLQIRNCSARSGKAEVRMECDLQGLRAGAPLAATIAVHNLALDDELHRALPPGIQDSWNRLGISGVIDATASIAFDGTAWRPRIMVRAKDGAINADFFPYPVQNLRGDFLYENGRIHAPQLTGMAGGQSLSGSLTLQRSQPKWLMDLIIAADGPIPIDEPLLRALTPRGAPQSGFQRFVNSLHPTGTVLLRRGRFIRTAENPNMVSRSLELTFSECTVKYDGFRYPIVDVHGMATLDNDRLVLREFVGRNDSARIKGDGFGTCRDSNLESFDLIFSAFDVPLDEELQQALPASAKNLWEQLQPTGTMDRIAVQIKRSHANDPIDLRVEMSEDETAPGSGRSIAFRPKSFPYSINDVSCSIDYRPGRIDIRALAGTHESSRIQAEGQIRLHSDGSWDGQIKSLPSSRLQVDQGLLSCLPPMLRDPMTRMNFRGPLSITGTTQIASLNGTTESLVRAWALHVELEDASLGHDLIAGIRGSLAISGENSATGTVAFGTMALDALSVKNVAVTGLEGPFVLVGNELLLGRDAAAWQSKNNARTQSSVAGLTIVDPNVVPAASFARSRTELGVQQALAERNARAPRWLSQPIQPLEEVPDLDVREGDLRARTLSGTMFLSGIEPLNGERARYRLRLVDADFHGLLVDLGETHTQASGQLSLQVDLQGSANNLLSMEGNGKAWLRGANLYELPFMIKLLGSLSVRPDQGAFNSADISFSIDGDRIPVNDLQLDGNLVSMRGSGWVNLRRELSFDLYANVGRHSLVGAVVRPFTQHRAANLMRIQVSGTTSNPQMLKSVPLMDSLEQVFPESP